MQYAILLYVPADLEAGPGHAEWEASLPHHGAFNVALAERGVTYTGGALAGASAATSLRREDGEVVLADGPAVRSEQQLWGYYAVEADDLDTVVDLVDGLWELDHGTVEVRPLLPVGAPA